MKLSFFLLASSLAIASQTSSSSDLDAWLPQRLESAEANMTKNISPDLPGYQKGFVVAAPWTVPGIQNYRYHWVRDAALVMNTVVTRYVSNQDAAAFAELVDYVNFCKQNQTAPEPADAEQVGLGEVKFNPDGSRYTQWMRPQNDGPALRAITLIRLARELIREGKTGLAQHLYDGSAPGQNGINAPGVIKADLDYLGAHWTDVSFDPWEEVKAHHFYTRLVQRKALLDGANLARVLGDSDDTGNDLSVAHQLETAINTHWIPQGQKTPSGSVSQGQIWDSFDRVYGVDYKSTGLDVAAVLGALHAHNELDNDGDFFYSPSDPRVLKTAMELSQAFSAEFPISQKDSQQSGLGVPIGRYPKDKYNGFDSSHAGNPWYLSTAAFAELYYRCAEEWQKAGKLSVSPIDADFLATLVSQPLQPGEVIQASDSRFANLVSSVRALGDTYLRTVKFHERADGHLNEEFSRDDGSPTGAEDLSWSYASVLTAAEHRH